MCLLLLAIQSHPEYRLILAANRDEYYERPTAPAAFWEEAPHLLAGKDLRAGGTWLGITTRGRIAAVTNYRDPASLKPYALSRGKLVSNFLLGNESPTEYLEKISKDRDRYNGFNVVIGEKDQLYWYSNRGNGPERLLRGIYGLSNCLLNTPWPKVVRSKKSIKGLLSKTKNPSNEDLFRMLREQIIAADEQLPDTGVGIEWERILSPIFITSPSYGTRSSTLIFIDLQDRVTFIERTFNGNPHETEPVRYDFRIEH